MNVELQTVMVTDSVVGKWPTAIDDPYTETTQDRGSDFIRAGMAYIRVSVFTLEGTLN